MQPGCSLVAGTWQTRITVLQKRLESSIDGGQGGWGWAGGQPKLGWRRPERDVPCDIWGSFRCNNGHFSSLSLHDVCFTKMPHHIELYYLKNSTAPGVGDGQGSLACWSPWGRKEWDLTEWLKWTEQSQDNNAKASVFQSKPSGKWKDKHTMETKIVQTMYLIRDWYPEHKTLLTT